MREEFSRRFGGEYTEEEIQKMNIKAIATALRTTTETNNPQEGAEILAHLYNKDSVDTMFFTPGVLRGRDENYLMPDWQLDITAPMAAHRQLLKQKYDMQLAMFSKFFNDEIIRKNIYGKDQSVNFAKFGERYVRQVLGFMDTTPSEMPEGYNYGIKTNLFKFHSDTYWADRITKIAKTFFGGKIFPEYKQLAGVAATLFAKTPQGELDKRKWIAQGERLMSEQKISWLSQMEAKWSLLSLLTSTRSFVTNISAAEVMTYLTAGRDAYLKSFRLADLQDAIGSDKIHSTADVDRLMGEIGGLESYLSNEFSIHGDSTFRQAGTAFADVLRKINESEKKGKAWKDADIRAALKESGVSDNLLEKASWFMRRSERLARSHSMKAHYINARKIFANAGFELEYNDPWIMQMTREGIKSSQFLYSNSERPAFMSTAVGKVFHRFQIFAYNAIEFRNNVIQQAHKTGIIIGSEDHKNFERMMVADLFTFGMAGLLPFSIFGSALPPPYNNIQNWTEYFFGTSEEKKRAFFGGFEGDITPLNQIVPPGLREIPQLFSLAFGSTQKTVGDMVIGMMPFQRVGKDIYRSWKNPALTVDNFSGIPLSRIPQIRRENEFVKGIEGYLEGYRSEYLSKNKKAEKGIQSYLDEMPLPEP